jgi:hypothetical protein
MESEMLMPKNRKQTYSDRQSQTARTKKQDAKKKSAPKRDVNQLAARIVSDATRR